MIRFQHWTFRRKLSLFAVVTSGSGLLIASAIAMTSEWRGMRARLLERSAVQVDIVASNLAASLSFDDPKSATETLAAFRVDSDIHAAYICDAKGTLFATYPATLEPRNMMDCRQSPGALFSADRLEVVRSIRLLDEPLGTVTVHFGLASFRADLVWKLFVFALTMGGALAAALLVSSRVRAVLLRPVSELAETTQRVAETGDYGTRVVSHTADELGHLADAFNLMVARAQERDTELRTARNELEHHVQLRTEELATEKERLARILRDIDAIVWEADAQTWRFSFVSDRASDLLGYPVSQWLDDPHFWVNLVHPDDRDTSISTCAEATRRGEDHSFAYRAIARDGRVVWLQDIVRVHQNEDGSTVLRGLMLDITERKRDEAFKVGHNRVMELLSQGAELSEALTALVTATEAQCPTMRCSILLLDEDNRLRLGAAPSLPDEYNNAIDGVRIGPNVGSCGTAAFTGKRVIVDDVELDSRWTPYRELARKFSVRACWSEPILTVDGRVLGTLAMYYSVPRHPEHFELQAIEAAAHLAALAIERTRNTEERKRLVSAIEATADGVIVTDVCGRIQYSNPAYSRITGFAARELQLKVLSDSFSETSASDFRAAIWKAMDSGQAWSGVLAKSRKDGSVYSAALTLAPVLSANGECAGYVGVERDVTEEIERKQALAAALAQAEAASRAKGEFLANMSHEIRTPMTAILGFTEQLVGDCLSTQERDDAVQTIHRNGQHLLSIINDILDISKLEAGKLETCKRPCDVTAVVADVCSLMRVSAQAKGLSLDVENQGSIPQTIETDDVRLRQILLNLVGNAIKFTERGSVRVVVRHRDQGAPEQQLQFSVIDTGMGIEPAALSKLFEPFSQADTSLTRRHGGTGLGLSIARRLSQLLGGDIVVESRLGHGSTFHVTISCGSSVGDAMVHRPAVGGRGERDEKPIPLPMADSPFPLQGCRVLLAEDGPDNQRLIGFVLKRAGADVCFAENGKLAMELAEEATRASRNFNVILMDMQMPVMDGYTATRELRSRGYRGWIIALTAHALRGDREKCTAAGCDDYATKPIDRPGLIKLVQEYFAKGTPDTAEQNTNAQRLPRRSPRAALAIDADAGSTFRFTERNS